MFRRRIKFTRRLNIAYKFLVSEEAALIWLNYFLFPLVYLLWKYFTFSAIVRVNFLLWKNSRSHAEVYGSSELLLLVQSRYFVEKSFGDSILLAASDPRMV